MAVEYTGTCHKCLKKLTYDVKIGRSDECPHCYAPLRCCLNCRFYDPGSHNHCREVGTEFIRDRAAANFCSSWEFGREIEDSSGEQAAAKDKLAALFGKK